MWVETLRRSTAEFPAGHEYLRQLSEQVMAKYPNQLWTSLIYEFARFSSNGRGDVVEELARHAIRLSGVDAPDLVTKLVGMAEMLIRDVREFLPNAR